MNSRNFYSIILIVLLYTSCKNKTVKVYDSKTANEINVTVAQFQNIFNCFAMSNYVATKIGYYNKNCWITTNDSVGNTKTTKINFKKTGGCNLYDTTWTKGSYSVSYTKPYLSVDSSATISFDNYTVSGNTYKGKLVYTKIAQNSSTKTFSINLNQLEVVYGGENYTLNGILKIESSSGNNLITGNIDCVVNNQKFSLLISEGIEISTDYDFVYSYYDYTNKFIAKKGKAKFIGSDGTEGIINYGDGQKDNVASYTSTNDLFRYIIELPEF
ncbi:MAG: hypothetical protein U0V72_00250 [Cytophagales bacterium]